MAYASATARARASAHYRTRAWSAFFPLVFIMAVSCGISFFFLQHQSLRLDESQSLWESGRSMTGILVLVAQDVHVPLYHELLHFWRLTFGDTVAAARSMSLLFFAASIPAIYFLGKRAYSRRVGLFAALLLGLSPFMNWYGNEIRMYTLFALCTILNQYFFIRIMRAREERQRAVWIGYGLTALFGIYTHYFFFVLLLSQALFYVLRRDLFSKKALLGFMSIAALLLVAIAPWLWLVHAEGQIGFQMPLLSRPTSIDLFNVFSQFLFGFQTDALNTILLSLWPVTLIFVFLTLRKGSRGMSVETQYFLTTLLFSTGAMFFISFLITPIFLSRYLIFIAPSLFLLLAVLFENYQPPIRAVAKVGIVCFMAVTLVIEIASPATPVKENYEQATDYINAHAAAQDVVIVSAPFTLYPVEYYYRGAAPLSTIPIWNQYAYGPIPPFQPNQLSAQVAQVTADYQDVWLLLSYNQGYEQTVKSYFDDHYQRLLTKNFSSDLTLYVYKVRYDTPLSKNTASITLQ